MPHSHFSPTYSQARAMFRERASTARAGLTAYELQGIEGLQGEALTCDVAWLGPGSPRAAVIVTSGTHGIEGYTGSGFQSWLLAQNPEQWLPDDTAVILVHAINPFGFSHGLRVNEQNIDLNRNFIDFSQPLPRAAGYDRLHDAIVPQDWEGEARSRADEMIRNAWNELGERGFQEAVCRGQHSHPDGLFYGGIAPSWSHTVWRGYLASLPRSIELLAHVDIHTGLGPFGYGELLYTLPLDVPAFSVAKKWYAGLDLRWAGGQDSAATPVAGTINHAVIELPSVPETMSVSIEFGTVEFQRMFAALRADNWQRQRAPEGYAAATAIRQEIADCFYPDHAGWRDAVMERCNQVLTRTLAGVKQRLIESGDASC